MKIIVLDGYTLNPGDLDWSPLGALGELTVHARSAPDEVLERIREAEVVMTNKVVLDASLLAQLPWLKYIGVTATGVNVVDLAAAREKNIVVTNVPGYGTASVAQMVFALLLEITQQVGCHARLVQCEGRWATSPDFSFWERPLLELEGLTFGVIGFGQIGRRVAAIARAFGMRVLVHTAHPQDYGDHAGEGVRFVELDELIATSDVISLHCPLTAETDRLIDAVRLAQMKRGAILINTGRGPLLDEQAVATALRDGELGALGADVLSSEPPSPDNPLLTAPNTFITPHIAWATREARGRLLGEVVANLAAFQQGRPRNVVN